MSILWLVVGLILIVLGGAAFGHSFTEKVINGDETTSEVHWIYIALGILGVGVGIALVVLVYAKKSTCKALPGEVCTAIPKELANQIMSNKREFVRGQGKFYTDAYSKSMGGSSGEKNPFK